ncbi:MAG: hypothetical protein Tsb009_23710 [Planctomycetaceae bacterium]
MKVFELEVGQSIQLGDRIVTVIDINDLEVSLRFDSEDGLPVDIEQTWEDEKQIGIAPS